MTPHTVFIIPYRDRTEDKRRFEIYIKEVLEYNNWREGVDVDIFFTHQCDTRSFNRGGMKNIGLKIIKDKYKHYNDITMIFHDVDTIPVSPSLFPYKTTRGVVSHYYGFTFVLGGILAIKACDFERIDGFPCFWGWGLEDNELQKRCIANGVKIDRSIFFHVKDDRVSCINISDLRSLSSIETYRYNKGCKCGYSKMKNIKYTTNGRMINVTEFKPLYPYNKSEIFTGKVSPHLHIIHPIKSAFNKILNLRNT